MVILIEEDIKLILGILIILNGLLFGLFGITTVSFLALLSSIALAYYLLCAISDQTVKLGLDVGVIASAFFSLYIYGAKTQHQGYAILFSDLSAWPCLLGYLVLICEMFILSVWYDERCGRCFIFGYVTLIAETLILCLIFPHFPGWPYPLSYIPIMFELYSVALFMFFVYS